MELENNDIDIRALDFLNDEDLSADALTLLRENDELYNDVMLMNDVQSVLRQQNSSIDVETRLKKFKQLHNNAIEYPLNSNADNVKKQDEKHEKPKTSRLRPVAIALIAAAACALLFIFLPNKKPTSSQNSDIFTADAVPSGISLTNEKGQKVELNAQTAQNTSITLDDFRRVLSDDTEVERVTLSVPYGKSTDITLPDGSVVYMHPGSHLVFPTSFGDGDRVVMLTGEAYFKVAKDAEHPFIVMTETMQTTVLGTEFNVNTATGAVTLINGSVRLQRRDNAESTLLKPGQQAVLTSTGKFSLANVDTEPYEFWRDGYFYFENSSLREIMEDIGRNFNMSVEFRDSDALQYRMRFIAERNKGVDAAIDMMNRMKKVSVTVSGNKIFVE